MTAKITRVDLLDFRNHKEIHLVPDTQITIIIGDNAVGKTNIIEAVQLLTTGTSFRNPSTEEVIRWGSRNSSIDMEIEDGKITSDIKIVFDKTKAVFINGNRRRAGDLRGKLPSVLFTPDDLDLIKGGAERRRDTLDAVGIQLSAEYHRLKKDFEKVVRQRNNLLKEDRIDEGLLSSWDRSLIGIGARFYTHRRNLFGMMEDAFENTYRDLFEGEKVSIGYKSSWHQEEEGRTAEEDLERALLERSGEERVRRMTLVGPHRDDLVFRIDGREARRYGSQGQQRTLTLVWKLAEIEVLEKVGGTEPVLLLDDVMSELDETRRSALLSYMGDNIQTFITTTNSGYFPPEIMGRSTVFMI